MRNVATKHKQGTVTTCTLDGLVRTQLRCIRSHRRANIIVLPQKKNYIYIYCVRLGSNLEMLPQNLKKFMILFGLETFCDTMDRKPGTTPAPMRARTCYQVLVATTHVNLKEGEVLVVEETLEHLQQRRQLVRLLLPLQVLRHLNRREPRRSWLRVIGCCCCCRFR